MPGRPGRPPKPTEFSPKILAAARMALLDAAKRLRLQNATYPAPTSRDRQRTVTAPRHLDVAVLAIELSQALEMIAGEHVATARDLDGVTWEEIGGAFGTSMQAAHARFHSPS
jgi:hypothetical protein